MIKNNRTGNRTGITFIFMHFGAFQCILRAKKDWFESLRNINKIKMLNWSARLDFNQRPLAPQAHLYITQILEITKAFFDSNKNNTEFRTGIKESHQVLFVSNLPKRSLVFLTIA